MKKNKGETRKKSTATATATATEVTPRICRHCYPTRFSRTAFTFSLTSQTTQVRGIAHNQRVVACNKTRKRALCHSLSYLPKELIFNILLHLPAKVLYEEMRYVCRDWYEIINDPTFIGAHFQFQLSSAGILLRDSGKDDLALYLQTNGTEVKLTELRLPFSCRIVGDCNGLVLLHDGTNHELFHVVNLITKVKVSLPPLVGLLKYSGCSTALSYASSGHYKVVHVLDGFVDGGHKLQAMICTVGADKEWRKINLQGISSTQLLRSVVPYSIAGFFYWFWCSSAFVLALDVDTEIFYQVPTPVDSSKFSYPICLPHRILLETGLGLVYYFRGPGLPTIWELTDVSTGKWTKVIEMDRAIFVDRLERMFYPSAFHLHTPFLFMKNGDFWFSVYVNQKYTLVCYNLKKGTILLCPTDKINGSFYPFLHVNTLLSLKN